MICLRWCWLPLVLATSCGGTPIRHYQVQALVQEVEHASSEPLDLTLSVRSFVSDAAYDGRRIVYRESDVRIDYYHYHRWAAEPGKMISTVLREVYRESGYFRSVVGEPASKSDLVLEGRIVALEEVDVSKKTWEARLVVELTLRDARMGDVLWSELVNVSEPLDDQSPEGLARAVGRAVTRIGNQTAQKMAQAAAARADGPSRALSESD